jgi:hypothetical protein
VELQLMSSLTTKTWNTSLQQSSWPASKPTGRSSSHSSTWLSVSILEN